MAIANPGSEVPEIVARQTIEGSARDALVPNRTFLANPAPSNAQVVAQVKALTRQVNGIIRILFNQLDGTD